MLKKLNQFTVAMQKINKIKIIKKLHIWTKILVFTLPLSFSLSFVGKKVLFKKYLKNKASACIQNCIKINTISEDAPT